MERVHASTRLAAFMHSVCDFSGSARAISLRRPHPINNWMVSGDDE